MSRGKNIVIEKKIRCKDMERKNGSKDIKRQREIWKETKRGK